MTLAAIYSRSSASCTKFLQAASSALPSSHPPIAIYNSENSPAKLPNETQIPCSGSLDDLLSSNSIDAVLLCLPISTQPSIIERALQNGKHVLSEKPIAPSLEIASPLVRRYMHEWQPKGLVWSVAEQWRHDSNVQRAGEALRSGELGRTSFFAVEYFGNNEQDNSESFRARALSLINSADDASLPQNDRIRPDKLARQTRLPRRFPPRRRRALVFAAQHLSPLSPDAHLRTRPARPALPPPLGHLSCDDSLRRRFPGHVLYLARHLQSGPTESGVLGTVRTGICTSCAVDEEDGSGRRQRRRTSLGFRH